LPSGSGPVAGNNARASASSAARCKATSFSTYSDRNSSMTAITVLAFRLLRASS